jgi:hypothetical protein
VLASVLVRTIGLDSYAVIASLFAVAALVVQSDLGITGGTFFKLRSHHLGETGKYVADQDDQGLVVTIVTLYIAIGVIRLLFWELRSKRSGLPASPTG